MKRYSVSDVTTDRVLTQEILKSLLGYDPDTGVFRWKIKANSTLKPGAIAGCRCPQGYWVIRVFGKNMKAHRLAWLYVYGYLPKRIDHIDRNRSNNAIANLRTVTAAQNSANRAARSANQSGYVGVYWNKLAKKWQARVFIKGKTHYIGIFDSADEAARLRAEYVRKMYEGFYIPSVSADNSEDSVHKGLNLEPKL